MSLELVREIGFEPTRLEGTDFKSGVYAIPPLPHITALG